MADSRQAPRIPSVPPMSRASSAPPVSRPSSGPVSTAPAPTTRPPPSSTSRASVGAIATRPSTNPPRSAPLRAGEEIVIALPTPRSQIVPSTLYRSTWVVSSLQSLRERGHFDRYLTLLAGHRAEILECVAGTWLPMEAAHAHYEACDALRLPIDEQLAMGRAVGGRAQGTILQTAVKAARGAGVTPWTILPQFDRLWRRGANGGAIGVTKIGPKEARVELVGCSLFDVDYFRNAFRGVLLGIGDMFCRTPYVHDLARRIPGEVAFQLQWV